jgi:hypothetical protein
MSNYAWIVDADPATDPSDELYRVGTTGPSNAPDYLIEMLSDPETGIRWRTKYEKDEDPEHEDIVHEGRLLTVPGTMGEVILGEEHFGPLWDLSEPDCGAVLIEYLLDDKWTQL